MADLTATERQRSIDISLTELNTREAYLEAGYITTKIEIRNFVTMFVSHISTWKVRATLVWLHGMCQLSSTLWTEGARQPQLRRQTHRFSDIGNKTTISIFCDDTSHASLTLKRAYSLNWVR